MRITIVRIWLAVFVSFISFVKLSFAQLPQKEPRANYHNQTIPQKEDQTKEGQLQSKPDYLKIFASDTKSILTAPLRWDKSNWLTASLVTSVTFGLYACDQNIQDWVQKQRNSTSDDIARFAKPFGDGRYTLPSLGAFYLYGHFFEDEKAQRTALMGLESFVFSGIFTQAIKYSGHRHRPSSDDSYSTWDGPGLSSSNLSFPSGHSCAAFSIATVIATEYDDIVFIPPLAYSIAALTAFSRVNDNDHWTSDAFFGSAIGYFMAKAVVGLHSEKEKDRNLSVYPLIDGEYAGFLIAYRL